MPFTHEQEYGNGGGGGAGEEYQLSPLRTSEYRGKFLPIKDRFERNRFFLLSFQAELHRPKLQKVVEISRLAKEGSNGRIDVPPISKRETISINELRSLY